MKHLGWVKYIGVHQQEWLGAVFDFWKRDFQAEQTTLVKAWIHNLAYRNVMLGANAGKQFCDLLATIPGHQYDVTYSGLPQSQRMPLQQCSAAEFEKHFRPLRLQPSSATRRVDDGFHAGASTSRATRCAKPRNGSSA